MNTPGEGRPIVRSEVRRRAAATPAGAHASSPRAAGGEVTPERALAIRRRLLGGAYDSAEIADQVAGRLLASGDL